MGDDTVVALVIGYHGAEYHGLQRQANDLPTVEQELERALRAVQALPQGSSAGSVHWSRTSRTDKGVSAAANVVALELQPPPAAGGSYGAASGDGGVTGMQTSAQGPGPQGLAAALNSALPPAVRVWGAVPVEWEFDARRAACGRRYEYLLPVWALDPAIGRPRAAQAQQQQQPGSGPQEAPAPPSRTLDCGSAPAQEQQLQKQQQQQQQQGRPQQQPLSSADKARARAEAEIASSGYAFTALEQRRLNLILGVYVGEHCWRNFTSEPGDDPRQVTRVVRQAYCEGPITLMAGPTRLQQPAGQQSDGSCAEDHHHQEQQEEQQAQGQGQSNDAAGSDPAQALQRGPLQRCQGSGAAPAAAVGGVPPLRQQFVRVVFVGDGFLMHQIRRMVGLALAVARKAAPPATMRAALGAACRAAVPLAPSAGLIMDYAFYDPTAYKLHYSTPPPAPPKQPAHAVLAAAPAPAAAAGSRSGPDAPSAPGAGPQPSSGSDQPAGPQAEGAGAGAVSPAGVIPADIRFGHRGRDRAALHAALHAYGDASQAFKRDVLYSEIAGQDPLELWLFLNSLTEAAHGFSKWAAAPKPAAAGAYAGPPAAGGGGSAGGSGPDSRKRKAPEEGGDS